MSQRIHDCNCQAHREPLVTILEWPSRWKNAVFFPISSIERFLNRLADRNGPHRDKWRRRPGKLFPSSYPDASPKGAASWMHRVEKGVQRSPRERYGFGQLHVRPMLQYAHHGEIIDQAAIARPRLFSNQTWCRFS